MSEHMQRVDAKQNRRNRLFFGVGTIGRDMVYTMISMYLMYYLTNVLSLSDKTMVVLAIVFMGMRIFDAINDPFMGWIVDNTTSRFGKFKPWIFGGAILSGLFTILMYVDFKLEGGAFVLVFALIYLLWEVAFTANDIAYWSMLPALSRDQKTREQIGSVARICANIGMFALVVGFVPITDALTAAVGNAQLAYLVLAAILVVLMLIFQFIMLVFVKEEHVQVSMEETTGLRELFSVILKNDQLLWTTVAMALFMIGYTTTTSFGLYYFEFIFGDKDMYGVFAAVLGVTQITALALFPWFSKRFSRKALYRAATIMVVIGYLIFYPATTSMLQVGIAGVLLFAGQAFIQLIMLMFISDCVEYGEYTQGRRHDSITLSLQPLINKIGGALSSGIIGLTVVYTGVKNASGPEDITDVGITWFKIAMLVVPLLLIAAGYVVYAFKYKIDEAFFSKMVNEISRRQNESD